MSDLVDELWGLDQNGLVAWLDIRDIKVWDTKNTTVGADSWSEEDIVATISWDITCHGHVQNVTVKVIRREEIVVDIGSGLGDLKWWSIVLVLRLDVIINIDKRHIEIPLKAITDFRSGLIWESSRIISSNLE